jgi:diaminohydroxyphosphoribosylaminopyrimidine deaminase/5-amino-6-(5-phosphoribosylamino)uracil reductase
MARALALAAAAFGRTSPNPVVGAVLVKDGRVVGEGHHQRAGAAHAEVEALRRAGPAARGATLYVTLEPCNHTGRTPPCCEAILSAGVARVVIAMKDPNPITNGRGLSRLRHSGVQVVTGILRERAERLNEPFRKAMTRGLPWTVAKAAQSLDGKIATASGESQWITSPQARAVGHRWRGHVDAILVGINTVLRDDPLLTARGARQRSGRPIKVIVDSRLRMPLSARCLSRESPAPTIIATAVRGGSRRAALLRRGAEVWSLPSARRRVPLRKLFQALARRGVQSVLIEGGGEVLASAFAERLVDRVAWCIAPLVIGGREAPGAVGGEGIRRLSQAVRLEELACSRLGPDLYLEARVAYPRR